MRVAIPSELKERFPPGSAELSSHFRVPSLTRWRPSVADSMNEPDAPASMVKRPAPASSPPEKSRLPVTARSPSPVSVPVVHPQLDQRVARRRCAVEIEDSTDATQHQRRERSHTAVARQPHRAVDHLHGSRTRDGSGQLPTAVAEQPGCRRPPPQDPDPPLAAAPLRTSLLLSTVIVPSLTSSTRTGLTQRHPITRSRADRGAGPVGDPRRGRTRRPDR